MGRKKQIYITRFLYFDEDKFKSHLKKRKRYNGISTAEQYNEIIRDIILNYDKVYEIIRNRGDDQLLLVKTSNWLLIFSKISFRISTCMKIAKRYNDVEEFLIDIKNSKKDILTFKEVNYEDSEFRRIIKRIQR